MDDVYERQVTIEADAESVFRWHTRPGAFDRLVPPWERVEMRQRGAVENGSQVRVATRIGPLTKEWVAEHRNVRDGESFEDVQLEGPFASWRHEHVIRPLGPGTSVLTDHVEYRLPGGRLGRMLGGRWARRKIDRMFAYRHRVTHGDLERHAKYGRSKTMRIAVTGASGLVGSALTSFLTTGGHEVVKLVRRPSTSKDEVTWDPEQGNLGDLGEVDAVVHLAGENIAAGRWNAERKRRIRESRTVGTRKLCEALAQLPKKPEVLVSASAIGFYGSRGDEVLDEQSAQGEGFLAEVCSEWEAAADPARAAGIRVVHPRIGLVLSPAGGGLAKMLTPFKLGAGGPLGDGRQYVSWIAIDDMVGVIHHMLTTPDLEGPVNAVAPESMRFRNFANVLGKVLHRPSFAPTPAFALRLMLGEMADALLLSSADVRPKALEASGFEFQYPLLEDALRHVLGRPARANEPERVNVAT